MGGDSILDFCTAEKSDISKLPVLKREPQPSDMGVLWFAMLAFALEHLLISNNILHLSDVFIVMKKKMFILIII